MEGSNRQRYLHPLNNSADSCLFPQIVEVGLVQRLLLDQSSRTFVQYPFADFEQGARLREGRLN